MDVRFAAASIACMSADTFAEILLYQGYEWVSSWQIQAAESVIRRLETPRQGTGVEALGRGDLLILDLGCPEFVDGQSLCDSERGQVRIGPSHSAVSVQLRVIAVPCGRAVISLRIVMIAVTVSAHVEQLVLGATRSVAIELADLVLEALPLRKITVGVKSGVGRIRAIDEAKVYGHEIKGANIRRGFILQEVPCDSSIIDRGIRCFGVVRLAQWKKSS